MNKYVNLLPDRIKHTKNELYILKYYKPVLKENLYRLSNVAS